MGVAVLVVVTVGDAPMERVTVCVTVGVGVCVTDGEMVMDGVTVGVIVIVGVTVGVRVKVGVGVGVAVGVGEGSTGMRGIAALTALALKIYFAILILNIFYRALY